jgi:hypothetical protein
MIYRSCPKNSCFNSLSSSSILDVSFAGCASGCEPIHDAKSFWFFASPRLSLFASTSPSLFLLDILRDFPSSIKVGRSIWSVPGRDIFENPGNSRRARDVRNNLGEAATASSYSLRFHVPCPPIYPSCVCQIRYNVQPCPRPAAGQRSPSCSMSHYASARFKKPLTQDATQLG